MAPEDTKSKWIKAATVLGVASIFAGAFYIAVKDTRDRAKSAQVQTTTPSTGIYRGNLNGKAVEYEVKVLENSRLHCTLYLSPGLVFDYDCNNTVDSVATGVGPSYERADLERTGKTVYFNQLLEAAQKLAVPENRIPDTTKEDLDRMLEPYK
ncbi:MAG: hypothetical protein AABX31_01070 [Nanoarchaeota archaeon]